jgi:two-component system chemotaxis response regulator CheY
MSVTSTYSKKTVNASAPPSLYNYPCGVVISCGIHTRKDGFPSMKVLIVEDTAILRRIMKDILKEYCGLTDEDIYEAEDGLEAIKVYKVVEPDIVFLDISMPIINGKKLLKHLLIIDPDALVVMFTGSRDEEDVFDCITAGAKDYLTKPLSAKRVQKAICKLITDPDKLPEILRKFSEKQED